MKRSEIVKTIKDFFYNNDFYNFDDEHADLLLSKLESQGMQPPQYFGYSSFPQWDREMQEIVLVQRRCLQNVWEPEKEEKDE